MGHDKGEEHEAGHKWVTLQVLILDPPVLSAREISDLTVGIQLWIIDDMFIVNVIFF